MNSQLRADTLKIEIERQLLENGPLTGGELSKLFQQVPQIQIWRICNELGRFRVFNCARYYLRYDITREDQIRLSPSVLRDFLSFTMVYLPGQKALAVEASARLANKHRLISLKKLKFARQTLLALTPDVQEALSKNACCFIAGDIAYFLAHDEPRVNQQLGVTIKGSDIDIIVVHDNEMPQDVLKEAEKQILAYKFRAMKDPSLAQEIDFLFKPVRKMLSQFSYSDIHQKIASKILYESFFLYGRLDLYENLKTEMEFAGTVKRIEDDFDKALAGRKETVDKILALNDFDPSNMDPDIQSLFYFSQERLEFQ